MKKKLSKKKLILLILFLSILPCSVFAEFVTIQEWLDTKGECDSMLLVHIEEVLNPVLAIVNDETNQVNLFSGGIMEFTGEEQDAWLVISNPKYNEFEGNVEMSEWQLMRMVHLY